jgi:protein MpaA
VILAVVSASLLSAAAAASPAGTVRHFTIGKSVQGRPIEAIELGNPASPVKVVVVGCIHGNEPAGMEITRLLAERTPAAGVDLWLIPDMNPDGHAAGTRENANGVDLNRNFPWQWHRAPRQPWTYTSTRPLSEPESRVVYRLLLRLKPRIVIWYHQALGVVDDSGGSVPLEELYSALVHLPFVELPRYPGSATSWVDHHFPGSTSFVVELPPRVKPKTTIANANAVEQLAGSAA